MRWRNPSLRQRLLVWLLVPLVLVCLALLARAYVTARHSANRAYDRALLGSALAIAERVVAVDGEVEVDLPYVALEMLSSAGHDRVFYKVTGPGGSFITGYPDLPDPPDKTAAGETVFYDATYRDDDVRIIALSRNIRERNLAGRFTVQVAETVNARDLLAREIMTRTAALLLVLISIAAAITWFGIGRSLRPLERLQGTIGRRSHQDLRPITDAAPKEVRLLVGAINDLMARLGGTIEGMQRFIGDASHQLRTPLAALRTQTELALHETDPDTLRQDLERLHDGTRRTSHLANQLLTLARAAPEAAAGRRLVRLDLAELAADVARTQVPRALENGIDLGFEGPADAIYVDGDGVLLRELLKNLVHNALTYCPRGSRVTVGVEPDGDHVLLSVEDDGPGIPPDHTELVFERFHRLLDTGGDGCGLGLAIVREIAHGHNAHVGLQTGRHGKGLLVRCLFPAVPTIPPEYPRETTGG